MPPPPSQHEASVPAIMAPPVKRDNPLTRSVAGILGLSFLALMLVLCLATLPWTTARVTEAGAAEGARGTPRYNAGDPAAGRLPPFWVDPSDEQARRFNRLVPEPVRLEIAAEHNIRPDELVDQVDTPAAATLRDHWPSYWLGTDVLGRSLAIRVLTGGGISLGIGLAAALLSVFIGTAYGAIAGYAGGRADAIMMRIVDVLYGLPYILLVVLLAVASDAAIDEFVSRNKERTGWLRDQAAQVLAAEGLPADAAAVTRALDENDALRTRLDTEAIEKFPPRQMSESRRTQLDVLTLLVAIGGVSWLTMARVIRGQVLSLKNQPFIEAARSVGLSTPRIFIRHLLPNLIGPIVVYATLTVPQAILQESFLSFLGIGVKPPLPSWGNLAADGLSELNPYESNWWLLLFPCVLLGSTLLALNFVGEGLREAFDPRRARR